MVPFWCSAQVCSQLADIVVASVMPFLVLLLLSFCVEVAAIQVVADAVGGKVLPACSCQILDLLECETVLVVGGS